MDPLTLAILGFVVLESLNISVLYFKPDARVGNGVGVFNAFERSRADPEVHALVRYLINWVAGTKLIFVALLLVIVATGGQTTKRAAVVALIGSILSFFWRLFPSIVRLDRAGQVTPRGYSKTLGSLIAMFILGFVAALAVSARG